jgi:hypothetical protein
MRANFFGDFEYYAEIDGQLCELNLDHYFTRRVKMYKKSNCMLGNDFVHVGNDPNTKPCIKMDFLTGSHVIRLVTHHTRPFKGISHLSLHDDNRDVIFESNLLPGEIIKTNIQIKKDTNFNLYLTFTSTEVQHGLIRVILITEPIQHDSNINIDLIKSNWVVKEIEVIPNQTVENIEYDTEYKY